MSTKLTIALPEELSRQAKARAALEGTTVSAVIRERLEEYAAGLELLEEVHDLQLIRELEQRLERGEDELLDWDRVRAELLDLSS